MNKKEAAKMQEFIKKVLENLPADWLNLTTHRLDIYEEKRAKSQFLEQFEALFRQGIANTEALNQLPTAYDYIRLGHPLSCVLEWAIAKRHDLPVANVISFSSRMAPILAILRTNALLHKQSRIFHYGDLPGFFKADILHTVYGYQFELLQITQTEEISTFDGSNILLSQPEKIAHLSILPQIDFVVNLHPQLGSVIAVQGDHNQDYIPAIQHVRRRETIAMTPANCLIGLQSWVGEAAVSSVEGKKEMNKGLVLDTIRKITGVETSPLVGSSGLSVQYAIMMGLTHDALTRHPDKAIKFIVPPNCYGGTNDQARRVAAAIEQVEIVDLPVDGDHDMVKSIHRVLDEVALEDAVPYIIVEIPTNPRVEVPNLPELQAALSKLRRTQSGKRAIDPVFILDQTFCPNVQFLGEGKILSDIRTISYVSGSKFPSGGKVTAGYCVGNQACGDLMDKIAVHLRLCDNEATALQYEILAQQLPSMNQRIEAAYQNTRSFVNFIQNILPAAKINFVSEELAEQGFTPSVFSLDLPTKGENEAEREAYKRTLNLKLIKLMIQEIPHESKHCVSYGQLKGCYWTIPATSTQGTTKESDKDYIARVALSPNMNLEHHQEVFAEFVKQM
ncbi:MAG: cystathionine beta-synthase [Bacteroidota bacterium]